MHNARIVLIATVSTSGIPETPRATSIAVSVTGSPASRTRVEPVAHCLPCCLPVFALLWLAASFSVPVGARVACTSSGSGNLAMTSAISTETFNAAAGAKSCRRSSLVALGAITGLNSGRSIPVTRSVFGGSYRAYWQHRSPEATYRAPGFVDKFEVRWRRSANPNLAAEDDNNLDNLDAEPVARQRFRSETGDR